MTRNKPLTAVEKNIIVKDRAKGITQAVARKLDRHLRTVLSYLENLAPMKTRGDGKGSTSTPVQFTQEAWEDKQTYC